MAKKTKTTPVVFDIVDNWADQILQHYPSEHMDPDEMMINQATGEENMRYQADEKYTVGGVAAQLGWSLTSKRKYRDTLQERRMKVEEEFGKEDTRTYAAQLAETKAEEKMQWYEAQFLLYREMFERLTGVHWGESQAAPSDDPYHLKWFADYKDRMADRKVLSSNTTARGAARLGGTGSDTSKLQAAE